MAVDNGVNGERRWHVLVVDDEPSILTTVRLIARREGWDITTTSNPFDVMDLARKINPTVILSDYMMPDMTGPELILALRRSPDTEAIPVVLMSGNAATDSAVDGSSGFLEKPFSLVVLRSTLERAVVGEAATPAR